MLIARWNCSDGWVRQRASALPLGCRWRRSRTPSRSAKRERARSWARSFCGRVERAARRKREAELEYEEAIVRAGRLGVVHRDVAAAAQVAHGTVRAIIARSQAASGERAPSATSATEDEAEEQPADGPAFIDVAAEQA